MGEWICLVAEWWLSVRQLPDVILDATAALDTWSVPEPLVAVYVANM